LFQLSLPWWDLLLRGAIVYLMVLLLLRLAGKRQVGDLTPFDFALLLLISEGASNAIRADENSITGAALVIAAMLGVNWAMSKLSMRSKRFDRLVEGRPRFLIRNGVVDYDALNRESVTHNDLLIALRQSECFSPHDAAYAVLETDGSISVCKRKNAAAAK
jgi:uncharacterized membrane protein YcaP (DUF421 family)